MNAGCGGGPGSRDPPPLGFANPLQLLAREDQALLVRRNALLVLDLLLDNLDDVGGLHVERDGLARQRLHEDLHPGAQAQHEVPSCTKICMLMR